MKAIIISSYGGPEVLTVTELPDPVPAADEVLIAVGRVALLGSNTGTARPRRGHKGTSAQRAGSPFRSGDEDFLAVPVAVLPPGTFGVVGEQQGVQGRRAAVILPGELISAGRIGQRLGNIDLQVRST
jgi:NADPH:quinone reductase-like Zn-dependent oxidoreductase